MNDTELIGLAVYRRAIELMVRVARDGILASTRDLHPASAVVGSAALDPAALEI